MKVEFKHLLVVYVLALAFFFLFFFFSVSECEAYWMHDASIIITHKWLSVLCFYSFLPPIILLLILNYFRIRIPAKVFAVHFLLSLISISTLTLSINKPCEFINGGHYMFLSSYCYLIYYLFKCFSLICLCYMIYSTIASVYNTKRMSDQK
jgi:hypothetical protein